MPAVHETAYPRLKTTISKKDLEDVYTPTEIEMNLTRSVAKGFPSMLCLLSMLKTFQRLGYFIWIKDVPESILNHIWQFLEMKTDQTPAVVERIVTDIDNIVKYVRFDGWQNTTTGEKLVQKELRKILWVKYPIKDEELFNRAYAYIREYY